ncbi:MAG: hypothetical protein AABY22_30795 [Nanoarchaeota archaeon]
MPEIIIERKPTTEELRNYIPVGMQTLEKKFKQLRVGMEQEFVRKHKPYCARCADLDFKDVWEEKKRELERKVGPQVVVDTKIIFSYPDLDKYGIESRFELKNKTPIIRDVIMDGVRVPKLVGHYFEYVCKERGCGRAVEVPLAELDLAIEIKKGKE